MSEPILLPWEEVNDTPRANKIMCEWLEKEGRRADDLEYDLFKPMQRLERDLCSALAQKHQLRHEASLRPEATGKAEELAKLIKEGQGHILGMVEAAKRDAQDAARYRWLNKQHNFLMYIEDADETRSNVRLRCGVPLDEWLDNRIKEETDKPSPQKGSPAQGENDVG